MEYVEVVDVLNVAFLEAEPKGILFREEVDSVKCLSLSLRDRRNIWGSGKSKVTREKAASILDDYLRVFREEKGTALVRRISTKPTGVKR